MADDEGASPREILMEACRRDNTELLTSLLNGFRSVSQISSFLNTARDGIGNTPLHLAAGCGSYEVLDLLLDQEGLEIDLHDRMEQDTALHRGVRYVNGLSQADWASGHPVVEILIDAGCDPRIRNKAKLRPVDLVDPRNTELRDILQKAEFAITAGDDVVEEDDDGPTGSASDSD